MLFESINLAGKNDCDRALSGMSCLERCLNSLMAEPVSPCAEACAETPKALPESAAITCGQLVDLLSLEEQSLLLLDLRSFLSFNQGHVKVAINMFVSPNIAKRKGFSLALAEKSICRQHERERFCNRSRVVLILMEETTASSQENEFMLGLFHYLKAENVTQSVNWLKGGYSEFKEFAPQHCSFGALNLFCPKRKMELMLLKQPPKTLHTDTYTPEPVQILSFLYLGDNCVASNSDTLLKYNVKYVLNAAVECDNWFEHKKAVHYKKLNLVDNPSQTSLQQLLDEACDFIDKARDAGDTVLVHCKAGQSRSVTIVLAYLMRTFGCPLSTAYSYVQSKRPQISPNLGFMGQLTDLEKSLRQCGRVKDEQTCFLATAKAWLTSSLEDNSMLKGSGSIDSIMQTNFNGKPRSSSGVSPMELTRFGTL